MGVNVCITIIFCSYQSSFFMIANPVQGNPVNIARHAKLSKYTTETMSLLHIFFALVADAVCQRNIARYIELMSPNISAV
jgi:hypothetical protein